MYKRTLEQIILSDSLARINYNNLRGKVNQAISNILVRNRTVSLDSVANEISVPVHVLTKYPEIEIAINNIAQGEWIPENKESTNIVDMIKTFGVESVDIYKDILRIVGKHDPDKLEVMLTHTYYELSDDEILKDIISRGNNEELRVELLKRIINS